MTSFKSSFLQELQWRGFIHQGTNLDGLDAKMAAGPIIAYIGFDATATSLHVGSLTQIMMLRLLQKHGHKPLVVMGDGTTRIGDPSGKDTARQLLSDADINRNLESMQRAFAKYLTFDGDAFSDATIVRNSRWLLSLNYIDFLRDVGRHFSVNRMLTFDSVKLRLEREQPLSFLEFNYMILQAYDFLVLNQEHNCLLQFGGSDQWGNIVNGVDLIRRIQNVEAFGLTCALITTSSGAKMGKTAKGAVWLNEDMLSPFDFWQFWRNTEDQDVGRFLRLFTDLPLAEIEKLEALQGAEINEAKKALADHATTLCHGPEAVQTVREAVTRLFEEKKILGEEDIETVLVSPQELSQGISLIDALCRAKLAQSNGEARRLIRGRGIRVNDQAVEDETLTLTSGALQDGTFIQLSAGKKRHALMKLKGD